MQLATTARFINDVVGGTEAYLRDVLPALESRGHNLVVFYENRAAAKADAIEPLPWR